MATPPSGQAATLMSVSRGRLCPIVLQNILVFLFWHDRWRCAAINYIPALQSEARLSDLLTRGFLRPIGNSEMVVRLCWAVQWQKSPGLACRPGCGFLIDSGKVKGLWWKNRAARHLLHGSNLTKATNSVDLHLFRWTEVRHQVEHMVAERWTDGQWEGETGRLRKNTEKDLLKLNINSNLPGPMRWDILSQHGLA